MWSIKGSFNGVGYVVSGDETTARVDDLLVSAVTVELAPDGGVLAVTPTGPYCKVDFTNARDVLAVLQSMTDIEDIHDDGSLPWPLVVPEFTNKPLVY